MWLQPNTNGNIASHIDSIGTNVLHLTKYIFIFIDPPDYATGFNKGLQYSQMISITIETFGSVCL